VLQKVRGLLAKAESTEFEAEAAALTAKAQELMTRHAIDRAALHVGQAVGRPSIIRVAIEAPYVDPKSLLLQLVAGIAWWVVATLLLARAWSSGGGPDEAAVLRALAIGGYAQILVASLAYFGPVLRGGGHERLSAGFATTRSWPGLVAGNAAAGALLAGADGLAVVALVAWAIDTAWRAVRLVLPSGR